MSPEHIRLRMPLSQAFAHYAAIDTRRSGGSGPTYEALELIEALDALESGEA